MGNIQGGLKPNMRQHVHKRLKKKVLLVHVLDVVRSKIVISLIVR